MALERKLARGLAGKVTGKVTAKPKPKEKKPKPKLVGEVTPPSLDPLDAPAIAQLTSEILQHHHTIEVATVETRAEVGRLLAQVKQQTQHGDWRRYIQERLPYDHDTVDRAIQLHRYATQQPERFEALKPFGLAKAQLLLKQAPHRLDELLAGGPYVVPSTGAVKPLHHLTYSELTEIVFGPADPPPLEEAMLRAYRSMGRKLTKQLDSLVAQRSALSQLDHDDLRDVYDDMLHSLQRFAEAFDLDAE